MSITLDELERRLAGLTPAGGQLRVVHRVFERQAPELERLARDNTYSAAGLRTRSGRLRGSIRGWARTDAGAALLGLSAGGAYVGRDGRSAGVHEGLASGRRAERTRIVPVHGRYLVIPLGRAGAFAEVTSVEVPARPFLRPALERRLPEVRQAVVAELVGAIAGEGG